MQRILRDTLCRLRQRLPLVTMDSRDSVRVSDVDRAWRLTTVPAERAAASVDARSETELDAAIRRVQQLLLALQNPDEGFWCAELNADTTLESDYILLMRFLGRVDPVRERKAASYIMGQQQPDGGWNVYRHGPSEINASVKAYLALKLHGIPPGDGRMALARERILILGGVDAANCFCKIYLCLFGLYDWRLVPSVVPEVVLLPRFVYFNIYAISSWSRAILIPLSIIFALRPGAAYTTTIDELFVPGVASKQASRRRGNWSGFFLAVDRLLRTAETVGATPLRKYAIKRATTWMLERFENSDGLGAIFPAMMNSIIALRALGYDDSSPVFEKAMADLETLVLERDDHLRIQPCLSPVWDTALTLVALRRCGMRSDDPRVLAAARWLVKKEVKRPGDWRASNPKGPVGGWFFENRNEFYPDTDDTAMVLMALQGISFTDSHACQQAGLRGLRWLLSMQSDNGGWGAFDRNNVREVLAEVPFADHNALLDPPTSDITGRVLEMMGCYGYDANHRRVRLAIEFLKTEQEADGSWWGRWGVNYIYGTWQVLRGLQAIGLDMMGEAWICRAAQWLKGCQNADGGWGESCESYERPQLKGRGPSTPSQTAWAVMGLMSAGLVNDLAVTKGISYLLRTQRPDGGWDEDAFTGTGFPKVFYLEYTSYRYYFPLMALSMYRGDFR